MVILTLLLIGIFALLVVSSHFYPEQITASRFELERRAANGNKTAQTSLAHEDQQNDITSMQLIVTALLLMIFMAISVVRFGWGAGVVFAIVVAMTYGAVGRIAVVRRYSRKVYYRHELRSRRMVEKFPRIISLLRHSPRPQRSDLRLESRQQLEHLIKDSHAVLAAEEKAQLIHGLAFHDRIVSDIMTPAEEVATINKKELLGPLVLDDLHKTGHSHFPVIDGDIHHIIGILRARDMLTLDVKRSIVAEKAMDSQMYYIRDDQTLSQALTTFTQTHYHLLIVINDTQETVGLLSLNDTLEALVGHELHDDFDAHNDVHAVANRSIARTKHDS